MFFTLLSYYRTFSYVFRETLEFPEMMTSMHIGQAELQEIVIWGKFGTKFKKKNCLGAGLASLDVVQ